MLKKIKNYFTKFEVGLWLSSVTLIVLSFLLFDRGSAMTLIASLLGITSLIFNAKGNPIGQVLIIIFSLLYGIISWGFSYYGEMITYLGMSAPMALCALISWLKNPYKGDRAQVKVNSLQKKEWLFLCLLSITVTVLFYWVLKVFGTSNLIWSTVSVTTSFFAAYLTFRRSAYFALAYATNDVVLIALWAFAATTDISYVSVIVCFITFLVSDLYGFFSWIKMEKRQKEEVNTKQA